MWEFSSTVYPAGFLTEIYLGLGLDAKALKKLSKNVFLLSFLPCLAEAMAVGIVAHLIMGFPWLWGFLLGFVQGAVSPAVLVPCMLSLQEAKLGTNKGIPTLLIAAGSLDDVLAISGYTVLLSVIFSTGKRTHVLMPATTEANDQQCGKVFGKKLPYTEPTC